MQFKYDIIASKFIAGIENHNRRNAPVSIGNDLGLIGCGFAGLVGFGYYCFLWGFVDF